MDTERLNLYDPMNIYRGRYKEFIESILEGKILNETQEYSENHHIIPRCTFKGENIDHPYKESKKNQYRLSAKNHFIAHRILTEENPNNKELAYAFFMMCKCHYELCTPGEYELGRKRQSDAMIGNKINLGRTQSEETKKKRSESMRGENNPFYGRGDLLSGENNPFYGKHMSEESREKLANSHKGKKHTEETKKKISKSLEGNKYSLGYKQSEETKKKRSESLKRISSTRVYNLICKSCGSRFISRGPTRRYCDKCSSDSYPEDQ